MNNNTLKSYDYDENSFLELGSNSTYIDILNRMLNANAKKTA